MKLGAEQTFEGTIKDDKKVLGSFGDERRVNPAELTFTDLYKYRTVAELAATRADSAS